MSTATPTRTTRARRPANRRFPAHGPIEAVLGFVLFYTVVDRVTPVLTTALPERFATVTPGDVGLALAVLLWVIATLSALDQLRRQLAALGYASHPEVRDGPRFVAIPTEARLFVYTALAVVGLLVAWLTFDGALVTVVRVTETLVTAPFSVAGLVTLDVLLMVVFFVAYAIGTDALDRLVVGVLRALTTL